MIKNIILPVLLAGSFCANATFVPVPLTGFNHDVVANGVGNASASTTLAVDQADWNLVAPDFKAVAGNAAPTAALPANGLINSAATTGLTYQLANYTGSNDLVISAVNTPATLTFGIICSGDVYVLGFTGSGTTTADIRVNFADNTTETFSNISFSDWYGGTGFAIQGIGRVNRTNNTLEAPAGDPRMYEKKLTLNIANAGKVITGITVTKTNATGVLNIMAVSVCKSPVVSADPIDKTICTNWNTFFQVTATNVNTYQWQVNSGAGFVNISNNAVYGGATTGMLTITQAPASYNNYEYRCVMNSTCGTTVYSKPALLTVTPDINITSIPTAVGMCTGGKAVVKIGHMGTAINYQWQVKTQVTGAYVDLVNAYPYSGVNTAQLEIEKAPDSLQNAVLRCIVTGDCNGETSADIPVTMVPSAYFTQDPQDITIAPYQNAKFDVMLGGGYDYTLYWQTSTNGNGFVNVNDNSLYGGTKAIALVVKNVQPSLNGLQARCILKSTNPLCPELRDTSEAAKIIIVDPNGVNDVQAGAGFAVYPNPVQGNEVLMSAPAAMLAKEAAITVSDAMGRVVYYGKMQLQAKQKIVFPAVLLPGHYIVNISAGEVQQNISILKQ